MLILTRLTHKSCAENVTYRCKNDLQNGLNSASDHLLRSTIHNVDASSEAQLKKYLEVLNDAFFNAKKPAERVRSHAKKGHLIGTPFSTFPTELTLS
jgi:hypothetical protein